MMSMVVIAAEVLRKKLQQERACWVVAGTRCGGKVQGEHAQKIANCMKCDFYLLVAQEEGVGGLINGLRGSHGKFARVLAKVKDRKPAAGDEL